MQRKCNKSVFLDFKIRIAALPLRLFQKMAGAEFVQMWRWMAGRIARTGPEGLWAEVEATRKVCPELHDVTSWLQMSPKCGLRSSLYGA